MSETKIEPQETGSSNRLLSVFLPLALVVVLFAFLYAQLTSGRDPASLPSVLIGKPIPEFRLPPVAGLVTTRGPMPGLDSARFKAGQPAIINVWASWCAPCQAENQVLLNLAQQNVPIYGINYKDKPENARNFLARLGNPFLAVGADTEGVTAIDFGVYGVPETFVIGGDGRILYRYAGPLTSDIVADKIMPSLRAASSGARRPAS